MPKHFLAKATDVPLGASRTFVKHGKKIIVANLGGEYFAYENFCPHMGGALRSNGTAGFKCSWHGAEFDVRTGRATNEVVPGGELKRMTVTVENGDLYWEQMQEKSPWKMEF